MRNRPVNTEITKIDRLRVVIGAILAIAGIFTLTVVGAMYGYSNVAVWLVGLVLVAAGLLLAGSMNLIAIIQGF